MVADRQPHLDRKRGNDNCKFAGDLCDHLADQHPLDADRYSGSRTCQPRNDNSMGQAARYQYRAGNWGNRCCPSIPNRITWVTAPSPQLQGVRNPEPKLWRGSTSAFPPGCGLPTSGISCNEKRLLPGRGKEHLAKDPSVKMLVERDLMRSGWSPHRSHTRCR